jgi:hypothetical protein
MELACMAFQHNTPSTWRRHGAVSIKTFQAASTGVVRVQWPLIVQGLVSQLLASDHAIAGWKLR